MPKLPKHATSRWKVMQTLADAPGPLDRRQLSELSGVNRSVVLSTLYAPRNAHWVDIEVVPAATTRGGSRKWLFTITDLGRQVLADYIKEYESS